MYYNLETMFVEPTHVFFQPGANNCPSETIFLDQKPKFIDSKQCFMIRNQYLLTQHIVFYNPEQMFVHPK